jgi:hypothetical protein
MPQGSKEQLSSWSFIQNRFCGAASMLMGKARMARSAANPRSFGYERASISRGANAVPLHAGMDETSPTAASGGGGAVAAASREQDEGCDSAH